MFLWLSVIDKKVAHPHEIQNTFVYNTVVFELHSFARTFIFDHFPLIIDFRSAVLLPYDYRSVATTDTRFAPNILGRACVFFRMAPSLDGERARQLANTLLGAKDGGHHHPKRTSALTSLRRQIRCCALATTIS